MSMAPPEGKENHLSSADLANSSPSKRARISCTDNSDYCLSIPAEEAICLVFDGRRCSPSFTHQLFDEETILIPSLSSDCPLTITLHVSLTDTVSLSAINIDSQKEVMSPRDRAELMKTLGKALPPSDSDVPTLIPVGRRIERFEHSDVRYEIWLATHRDENACELLSRCEKLAIWFIETADGVDFRDDRWEALFLFEVTQRNDQSQYRLAGYMTLFTFRNPVVGSKLRVCQALVFPGMQRGGLGSKLLQKTYFLAAERLDVSEVTVEDPCPGFSSMRDRYDSAWLLAQADRLSSNNTTSTAISAPLKSLFQSLSSGNFSDVMSMVNGTPSLVPDAASALKITVAQTAFAIEAIQYMSIPEDDQEALRSFRLGVKRRLLRSNKDLKSLEKALMQEALEDLYKDEQLRYDSVRRSRENVLLMKKEIVHCIERGT